MSDTLTLYVVDEKKLPTGRQGLSDQELHDKLVASVQARGARWGQLEMDTLDFAEALEIIDEQMGGTKFLPVFAFNNSPNNVLGDDSNCPSFGYFSPEQVRDLKASLDDVPNDFIEEIESADDDTVGTVLHTLRSAADEAARRGYALAILHT
ncbi:hypothetical protein JQX13_05610 [Archangium violaceum]|uniref:hypothetical protein n=1 Tax=Archangium violaceum TaxID=83451 RepID=UPI00193BF3FF|nr:hypothetical protein [Archangium violaceum]QRK09610.1 hypothetical protein JQX13_05610 [Archangium violaceum]